MIRSPVKKRKKPGPPRTTGPGEQVVVRLHKPMLDQLDLFREKQGDNPTRAEGIRRLMALGLADLMLNGDKPARRKK